MKQSGEICRRCMRQRVEEVMMWVIDRGRFMRSKAADQQPILRCKDVRQLPVG